MDQPVFPPPEHVMEDREEGELRCQKIHQDQLQEVHLQEPREWEAEHHNYYQITAENKKHLGLAANLQGQQL